MIDVTDDDLVDLYAEIFEDIYFQLGREEFKKWLEKDFEAEAEAIHVKGGDVVLDVSKTMHLPPEEA